MVSLFGRKKNESEKQEERIRYAEKAPARTRRREIVRGAVKSGGGFLKTIVTQRRRQLVFARDVRRPIIGGGGKGRGGGRGRPKGTVKYRHPVTGQPIGVYEYRKILSAQLRGQRIKQLRDAAITPEQQAVLRQIENRKRLQSMAPENKTIPDTYGAVNLKSIHDEVDDYANLFP
jgi:hypothetical protein